MVFGKRFKTFTSLFCPLWIFGSVFHKCIFLVYFAHALAYIHVTNFYCQYMLQLKPSKHNILCLSNWRIFSKDWWGLIIFLHLIKVTVVGLLFCMCFRLAGRLHEEKVFTEDDWSDEERCIPYEKSKLRAEKAAWELVKNLPGL